MNALSRVLAASSAALAIGGLLIGPARAGGFAASVHVTGLSRHAEPTWGGDWITVRGTGFAQSGPAAVKAVWFGQFRAGHTRVLDDRTILAYTPEVDGRRRSVRVVVQLRDGARSRPTASGRFTFVVPTVRTPAHDGLSTLQSRALGAKVIRRVKRTPAPALAPRSPSWTSAEGLSALARAKRWLGMPYTWGGGNAAGPTYGNPHGNGLLGRFDATFRGFDCSGLALYAWAPYRSLPHWSGAQFTGAGRFHPTFDELQPGDLLFFSGGGPVVDHVVIYAGGGQIVQAPESGHVVEVSSLADVLRLEPRYFGATRPASTSRGGPTPVITGLSSSQDAPAGGSEITIQGQNLDTTSTIRFGGTAAAAFTVVSPSEVRVTVPPGQAGTVSVQLTNAWGVSADVEADRFTYAAATPAPTPTPTPQG